MGSQLGTSKERGPSLCGSLGIGCSLDCGLKELPDERTLSIS